MIIVKVIGGLGNQMFQYAAGRSLADRLSVSLKLDISGFREYDLRHYSLWALNISEELATDAEIAKATGRRLGRIRRGIHKFVPAVPAHSRRQIVQSSFAFEPQVLSAPDGTYLDGYWQCEKYFADCEERLRVEFSLRAPSRGQDIEVAEQIRGQTSVSLHVRRGDYVSDVTTSKIHGVCDGAYYQRCIRFIAERVENPRFFVFSDEPDWARENLDIGYPATVVAHNNASHNFEDLRLMSLCDHHIIANSSFSWWGAWLDPEPTKIVLMPKRWLADRDPEATADIRPQDWIPL